MLPHITYRAGTGGGPTTLMIDACAADEVASLHGTPTYVYARQAIAENFRRFERAFSPVSPTLCYALKAGGNLHLLRDLADMGAGMDVVSGGELERAWLSGAPMSKVVFAGVGKTEREIAAALCGERSLLGRDATGRKGEPASSRGPVGLFNIESPGECERIDRVAASLGVEARGCIRVNPDVDAHTHRYTTTGKSENKFGIDLADVPKLFATFSGGRRLRLVGLHVHLGSPIASPDPFVEAIGVVAELIDRLRARGASIEVLNIGGGYGVDYGQGAPATIEEFAAALLPRLGPLAARGVRIVMEPGRSIVCRAGVLLTRVQYVKRGKTKSFVIGDAGMHTLIRPALYEAYHFVWPVTPRGGHAPADMAESQPFEGLSPCDVVGPVCESSDFLAQGRRLPPIEPGDLLAVFCAGAYGMSMSMNYNDHPRPAEVLVDGGECRLIRPRQKEVDLIASELNPGGR
jgi:diaminopimelate decarboxylase